LGVTPGRTTAAQLVRYTLTFITFVLLLVIAALMLILDHSVDRTILLLCALLVIAAIIGTFAVVFIISSRKNLMRFSDWLTNTVNKFVRFITRGHKKKLLKPAIIENFFGDLHDDYLAIRRDIRVLFVPFIWAIIANVLDVALLFIAFWALGVTVNPAALFIAFGLSSIGGVIAATPGGAGAYEVIMVAFLSATGVEPDIAIAGTLLARVTLVLGTIIFGYIFYQLTINKYGKHPTHS
jgi:putative heme transporter